jgi:hypothetical protein
MSTEREVLPPALAQRKAAGPQTESVTPPYPAAESSAPAPVAQRWKFVKNFGVADVFKFKDGTSFTFRQINRNTDFGIHPNSFIVTSDEKLAGNLRELAQNPHTGVVEVTV